MRSTPKLATLTSIRPVTKHEDDVSIWWYFSELLCMYDIPQAISCKNDFFTCQVTWTLPKMSCSDPRTPYSWRKYHVPFGPSDSYEFSNWCYRGILGFNPVYLHLIGWERLEGINLKTILSSFLEKSEKSCNISMLQSHHSFQLSLKMIEKLSLNKNRHII